MRHEFEYDPTKPGGGLGRQAPREPFDPGIHSISSDGVAALMAHKQRVIEHNTRELEKAYVKHQHVLVRFDRLIRSLDRLADTPELRALVTALRLQRAEAERLLFTGGHELRRDSMTMRINLDL